VAPSDSSTAAAAATQSAITASTLPVWSLFAAAEQPMSAGPGSSPAPRVSSSASGTALSGAAKPSAGATTQTPAATDNPPAASVQQTAASAGTTWSNEAQAAASHANAAIVNARAASQTDADRSGASRATDSASAPLSSNPLDAAQSQAIADASPAAEPATTSATGTATPAAAPQPAPPAAQVAPALLTLGQSTDGGQQMTLRLHPAELGMVQVQIDKTAAGAANVAITVEKPETLQAILRDQADLHHALDTAGIPSSGRTITITLAPEGSLGAGTSGQGQNPQQNPQQNTATNAGSTGANGSGNQAASGDSQTASQGGGPGDGQGGGQGGGRGGYQTQDGYAAAARRQSDLSAAQDTATAGRWSRVGVNITA
jgi:flagellar hook-length control protein FliK